MAKAVCPGCKRPLLIDEPIEEGDYFGCPFCEADLELVSLRPLLVDWAEGAVEQLVGTPDWHGKDRRVGKEEVRKQRKSHHKYVDPDFDTD